MKQKQHLVFGIIILGVILISGCTQNNSKQIQDLQSQISDLQNDLNEKDQEISKLQNIINQQNSEVQSLKNQIQILKQNEETENLELESCMEEWLSLDYIPAYYTGHVLVEFTEQLDLEDVINLLIPIGLTETQAEDIRQACRANGLEGKKLSALSVPVPIGKEIIKLCELRKIDKIEIAELDFVPSLT